MGKEYWKVDTLRKIIKIEEAKSEGATITLDYITYLKEKLDIMENAYNTGVLDSQK